MLFLPPPPATHQEHLHSILDLSLHPPVRQAAPKSPGRQTRKGLTSRPCAEGQPKGRYQTTETKQEEKEGQLKDAGPASTSKTGSLKNCTPCMLQTGGALKRGTVELERTLQIIRAIWQVRKLAHIFPGGCPCQLGQWRGGGCLTPVRPTA